MRSRVGDPTLTAVVAFTSPRNLEPPDARKAFVADCVAYLARARGLVVCNVVTRPRADCHAALLEAMGVTPPSEPPSELAAWAYRAHSGQLQAWHGGLELGRPLPTVPLWLASDVAVPLDLDAGYAAACADVAIRPAG